MDRLLGARRKVADLSIEDAVEEQRRLASQVITEGDPEVQLVCGVDVAYEESSDRFVAAAVVIDVDTFETIETATSVSKATFPYVPGLFSFREAPGLLEAFAKLKQPPDLVVCDGQGYAHPRRLGIASHVGLVLQIPTIGCAKKLLVGTHDPLDQARGASQPILDDGCQIGHALRTQTGTKEVFVSPGHLVGFDEARQWILRLATAFRLPETTRRADQLANSTRKDLLS